MILNCPGHAGRGPLRMFELAQSASMNSALSDEAGVYPEVCRAWKGGDCY